MSLASEYINKLQKLQEIRPSLVVKGVTWAEVDEEGDLRLLYLADFRDLWAPDAIILATWIIETFGDDLCVVSRKIPNGTTNYQVDEKWGSFTPLVPPTKGGVP